MSHFLFALLVIIYPFHVLHSQSEILVLKGGTIIDVTAYGKSIQDQKNATVIIENGKIKSVSSGSSAKIPKGAKVIDIAGKFIVPGLIDVFATVNNQAYANAFLYMGVTTVVALDDGDGRRGKVDWTVNPSPAKLKFDHYWGRDFKMGNTGFEKTQLWDNAKIKRDIDSLAKEGVKVLLIHYGVEPSQLAAIVTACKANKITTIGELGLTSYEEAVKAGVQSFVHTGRYTADILPDSNRIAYSTAPFGAPGFYYYQYITTQDKIVNDPKFLQLVKLFSTHNVGLIPTASMIVYPEMDFAKNPWAEPIASIIDEADVNHEPLDKSSGKRKKPSELRSKAALPMHAMDEALGRAGAHFLTGSGTDAFGTLPGISLHTELEMLSHSGLSNREALAAATHNFSLLMDWTEIGKIETGREADVLVLDANPIELLENLKKINVLIVDGKIIDREKLLTKP